jgi:hypothetical protein|tara:strand:- start:28836 stop:29417 length:582 start_codon:yes stop_codon:yes gene_type:complete
MARTPLTKEQMAAKVAKMKATKAANKAKALETLGLTPVKSKFKKARKKRVMTEEQKAAAIARLAKARENRGPSLNKLIDENVRNLPDENPLSLKNVREWIKENKELLSSIKDWKESKEAKQRLKFASTQTYVANLEGYLRSGVYLDNRWGTEGQNAIQYRVTNMAYYKDGTPKRTVGYMYPDVGIWTKEMEEV